MINVTCAIILFGNKVLVTQRSENMLSPLKWEFPGGKLKEGESEVECIKREITEEIDIKIKIFKKISNSIYDNGTFVINLIPFIAFYISGEIKLAEHRAYKLLNIAELTDLDWSEADLPIVEEILKLRL